MSQISGTDFSNFHTLATLRKLVGRHNRVLKIGGYGYDDKVTIARRLFNSYGTLKDSQIYARLKDDVKFLRELPPKEVTRLEKAKAKAQAKPKPRAKPTFSKATPAKSTPSFTKTKPSAPAKLTKTGKVRKIRKDSGKKRTPN